MKCRTHQSLICLIIVLALFGITSPRSDAMERTESFMMKMNNSEVETNLTLANSAATLYQNQSISFNASFLDLNGSSIPNAYLEVEMTPQIRPSSDLTFLFKQYNNSESLWNVTFYTSFLMELEPNTYVFQFHAMSSFLYYEQQLANFTLTVLTYDTAPPTLEVEGLSGKICYGRHVPFVLIAQDEYLLRELEIYQNNSLVGGMGTGVFFYGVNSSILQANQTYVRTTETMDFAGVEGVIYLSFSILDQGFHRTWLNRTILVDGEGPLITIVSSQPTQFENGTIELELVWETEELSAITGFDIILLEDNETVLTTVSNNTRSIILLITPTKSVFEVVIRSSDSLGNIGQTSIILNKSQESSTYIGTEYGLFPFVLLGLILLGVIGAFFLLFSYRKKT